MMNLSARLQRVQGALALMYHTVADVPHARWFDPRNLVPADVFARQMEFLKTQRRVISLEEMLAAIRIGRVDAGQIVLTFDDGYLDNLTVAAPILDRLGLTATLFLPTAYIDRGENQWIDQVYDAFQRATTRTLRWPKNGAGTDEFNVSAGVESTAYRVVCDSLLTADALCRRERIDDLRQQLKPSEFAPRTTMNWDDVRTLLRDHRCFEIGAHTVEHIAMTSVEESTARRELTESRERIADQIGVVPTYFSFPYGRTSDRVRALARECGYECAFGGGGLDPLITADSDPFQLPRVAAPASMSRFDMTTSSANSGVWRRLGR